jgi:hypothetical protein
MKPKILTENDLNLAIERDINRTIKEISESADLLIKGQTLLSENKISKNEYNVLNEGAWETIKYGLSKLGRYKAGGKIFGKGKIDQESAAKIQSILDKKGNELIKKLNDTVKSENPEFPNNKEGEKFLKTVMEIAAVYDSIVAATKKDPKDKEYLPTDAANAIIADLAEYVKKFLDVDLAGAYTVMDSEEDKVKDNKDVDDNEDGEELLTDEVGGINEDEASDTREKLKAKGGDTKYDTKRMGKEGLASNRLPIILSAVGASLGALGWMAQTQWFKDLVTTTIKSPDTFTDKTVTSVVDKNVVVDPKGWSYTIQNNGFQEATGLNLGPDAPAENLHKAFKFYGGGNEEKGIEAMSKFLSPDNQAESIANLKAQLADPSNKTVGNIFNVGEGTYGSKGMLFTQFGGAKAAVAKLLVSVIKRQIIKGATKTVVTSGLAKGLMAIAPALTGIGIGLLATGVTVKLMRMKGQKQSRAATLNDLLQSLQPVKASQASLPPVLPPPPNPADSGKGGKGGKNCTNCKNLNELNKLLNKVKSDSKNLAAFKDYMKDDEFRDIFFSAIADVNQSVKINKQPLVKALADLRSQGLIEAPTGRQRKYLKYKLDFQNFMTDVFKLFAGLSKCGKESQTFGAIKDFYKQLYVIATQGKNAGVKSRVKFDTTVGSGLGKKDETSGEEIKVGEEYFYTNKKGQKDVVKVISLKNQVRAGDDKTFGTDDDITGVGIPEDSVWVTKAIGRSGGKNTYSAKAYLADKSKLKKENVTETEGSLINEDANKDLRDKLFKKLAGNFENFLNGLNKLKPMEKCKEGKPSEEEIAKRREAKKGKGGEKGTEGEFAGSAPRTKPPQLAHYDRGDKYLNEEINKIKNLMSKLK